MLAQLNRLKKKKDFEKVFKLGKGIKLGFIALKINKNNFKNSRFGFVVSLKVSKKAVVRNKVKRRLREIVRARIKDIKKGIDVVLIALPDSATKEFEETEKLVEKLFKKAGILI
ncbi:MAG: ribonuclease P protein component [Candidatus Nealsonbacteria bacterium]